ncbi:MAG: AMP-binding protein [Marinifilaceae bacterium]
MTTTRIDNQPINLFVEKPYVETYKEEVRQFLLEWFNDKPYVNAQTSGSTGTPKALRLLKTDMLASARMTNAFLNIDQSSTLLLSLSPNYIAGKMMLIRAISAGANILLEPPTSSPFAAITNPIDLAALVPMQVEGVLDNHPQKMEYINALLIGGAPISPTLEKRLEPFAKRCYATYGMTETVSHVALRPLQCDAPFTALGNICFETDSRDCLIISAPHLSVAHLVTNDVVKLHSSTSFTWLGRADNVINSGGIKLFPEQLERLIAPLIHQRFYFTGIPHARLGQCLALYIESEPWTTMEIQELNSRIKEILPSMQCPKEIRFISRFTETPSGKVKRETGR